MYRIVRNKAADTARMSNRAAQHSELGVMLPTTSTTRPSGQTAGITLTDDEQAAAHLYAIGSLLQGAGAQQQQQAAAAYMSGAGSGSSGGVTFNPATSLVNRRTLTADDGECTPASNWTS